jgi:SNF2 family DNA or RNA helicase
VEFASICAAANGKVIVFSQFFLLLCLIIDQLKLALKWTEDEKILYIYGKVKNRQSFIHIFNNANSQVEILLASSFKGCPIQGQTSYEDEKSKHTHRTKME